MERRRGEGCFWPEPKDPHTSPPRVPAHPSDRLPTLSPELQYEINIGSAGNERSPQEIEQGGKEREETKEKHREKHTFDFWHPNVHFPLFLYLLLSLSVHLSASVSVNICLLRLLVYVAVPESTQNGFALGKAPGLLFFPGTVIRWLSQESGQPLSYFSRALFLLFHIQRQHDPL